MRIRFIPAPALPLAAASIAALALPALVLGASPASVGAAVIGALLLLAMVAAVDALRSTRLWRSGPAQLRRLLPDALAIGVPRDITIEIDLAGGLAWQGQLYDHHDASLVVAGMPARARLTPGQRTSLHYRVIPRARGLCHFKAAELRLRSRLRLWDLQVPAGEAQSIRVYPDFSQVTRYAWLSGDRRLQEIGVRTRRQRGGGTDFHQLAEYRRGDPVRAIDWKATLRHARPIARQYQEERDQRLWLLVDCGRRMRADEHAGNAGTSHFDQILNAVMLLAYVALREGDAVGARTFAHATGTDVVLAPRKGAAALAGLMSGLYDLQPGMTQPDYVAAARDFLAGQPRRSLVVLLTNFRDEDSGEIEHALRLLRQRHLVIVASMREQVIHAMQSQALSTGTAVEIASAHLYGQARQAAIAGFLAHDHMVVDAEPQRLGIELVNRYHSAKRAGLL